MSAGTITVTNNSATVNGSGTGFTTEFKAGDFIGVIAGGTPYTLIVTSIASNTQLTIGAAYTGPTAGGLAWYAVPASLMYAITQQAMNDMGKILRGMIQEKSNWQQIYSASGNITVTLPDGSQFTGTSWNNIATTLSGKMDKSQNLNDLASKSTAFANLVAARTAAAARVDLALGTAATYTASGSGTATALKGQLATLGSTITGASNGDSAFIFASSNTPALSIAGSGNQSPPLRVSNGGNNSAAAAMTFIRDGSFGAYFGLDADNVWRVGGFSYGNTSFKLWTEQNTTVDGNGFIKRASPIVRVADTASPMPDNFVEGNFVASDYCAVNSEAEGVTVSKTATGVYEISGTEGPYTEGWTIEIPQDVNGNRLCFAETTFSKGVLILRTFKRKFDLDTASVVAGDPIDIPAGRWVDLRVAMSANSTFNKKAAEAKAILQKQLEDEMSSQEEIDSSQETTS
jgi:hypothetical protein